MSVQPRGTNGEGQGDLDDDEPEEATSPGTTSGSYARGFSAQLRGVSLWDLVQMECLARSRLIVRVVGDGGVGYLYFDNGQVLHATTAQRTGEPAAIEILGWTNGSFQPCERAWPERSTIATSHEALILQAAQLRDESRASNLVAFPGGEGRKPPGAPATGETLEYVELEEIPDAQQGEVNMRGSNSNDVAPPARSARLEPGGDFSVMMRLGANGAVITNRGGGDDFAETVAYAERLLVLVGELLGLEAFSAIECSFVAGRCLVFTEGEGEIVAVRPRPEANLQPLRQRLGL